MVNDCASAKRSRRPLDAVALDRLALRYVERFATTEARLTAYLVRKIRERGWDGPPVDPASVARKLVDLGYVDDRQFGEARATAMARRGLGPRRVRLALRAAGLGADDSEALAPAIDDAAVDALLRFAQRRRIGPFASERSDPAMRERQLAAMLRAGHALDMAKKIVAMLPEEFEDQSIGALRTHFGFG